MNDTALKTWPKSYCNRQQTLTWDVGRFWMLLPLQQQLDNSEVQSLLPTSPCRSNHTKREAYRLPDKPEHRFITVKQGWRDSKWWRTGKRTQHVSWLPPPPTLLPQSPPWKSEPTCSTSTRQKGPVKQNALVRIILTPAFINRNASWRQRRN